MVAKTMRREELSLSRSHDCGITNAVETLDWTFDDRVREWREKYANQPKVFEVPE
jgi:DUF438 domain-containing protein